MTILIDNICKFFEKEAKLFTYFPKKEICVYSTKQWHLADKIDHETDLIKRELYFLAQ